MIDLLKFSAHWSLQAQIQGFDLMQYGQGSLFEGAGSKDKNTNPETNSSHMRIAADGTVWRRSPKGGLVSKVNGIYYPGGQWVPTGEGKETHHATQADLRQNVAPKIGRSLSKPSKQKGKGLFDTAGLGENPDASDASTQKADDKHNQLGLHFDDDQGLHHKEEEQPIDKYGHQWRQNDRGKWAWFQGDSQKTGAYDDYGRAEYAAEAHALPSIEQRAQREKEESAKKFEEGNNRLFSEGDKKWGHLSDEDMQKMIDRDSAAGKDTQHDREFDGMGGRRSGPAMANQGARDAAESARQAQAYLEIRKGKQANREQDHIKESNLEEARTHGRQAAADGRGDTAAHDPEFNNMLEGRTVGETPPGKASSVELMDAWEEGHKEKPGRYFKSSKSELEDMAADGNKEAKDEIDRRADKSDVTDQPELKPGKVATDWTGIKKKEELKKDDSIFSKNPNPNWDNMSGSEQLNEFNKHFTQVGDQVDIGGNSPITVTRVNKKSISSDGGARWPFSQFVHTKEGWKDHLKRFKESKGDPGAFGSLSSMQKKNRKVNAKMKDLNLLTIVNHDGLEMIKNASPNAIPSIVDQLANKTGHDRSALRKAIQDHLGDVANEEAKDGLMVTINSATPHHSEIKHALENVTQDKWGDWRINDPVTGEPDRVRASSKNKAVNWFINRHRKTVAGSGEFSKVNGRYTSWLKSHGTTEKKLMGIDTKAQKAKAEEVIRNSPMTLKDYGEFHQRLDSGDVSLDEYKEAYAKFQASKAGIRAELAKMKKADIEAYHHDPDLRRFSHHGGRKDQVIENMLGTMHDEFDKNPDQFGWSYGEDSKQKRSDRISGATDDHLEAHAKEHAKSKADREQKRADRKKRFENPQTVEDWKAKRQVKGWDNLTPDEQASHDEAYAQHRRDKNAEAQEASWEIKGFTGAGTTGGTEIVTGHHQKHDKPTFTVRWNEYVGDFDELKAAARKLGGNYVSAYVAKRFDATMGFQFFDPEAADKLKSMMDGEKVDIGDQARARLESKQARATETLSSYADRLRGRGDSKLNQKRKDNTARRARMAASAEADARDAIAKSKTIDSIVMAQSEGTLRHLNGVKFGTHVDLLQKLHRFSKYDNERAIEKANPDMGWKEKESMRGREPNHTDIAHAQYPYPMLWRDQLTKHASKLSGVPGLKMFSKKLNKWAKSKDSRGSNRMIIAGSRDLEAIKAAIPKMKRHRDQSIKSIGQSFHDSLSDMTNLRKMDITNGPELRAALREFESIKSNPEGPDPIKEKLRELKRDKTKGFFPTPKTLVEQMLDHAGIEDHHSVLEPSAGVGDIIDSIKSRNPDQNVHAIEQVFDFADVLGMKGHAHERGDFLAHKGQYDRIVMNPPFENRQDEKHVQHAYDNLKPGGRIVAITGSGAHQNQRSAKFQNWLSDLGAEVYDNPEGSFNTDEALKKTGVNTKMVIIDKPETETSKFSAEQVSLNERFSLASQAQRYGLLTVE